MFWLSQLVSTVGDRMVAIALVFAVIGVEHSATAVGIVLAARTIPEAMFMLAGGVWADRLPRQQVLVTASLVEGAAQASIAALLFSGHASLTLLAALTAVYGTAAAFFQPASTGITPTLVEPGQLQQANGLISLAQSSMSLLGPPLGAALVVAVGSGSVFIVDAASFLLSAGLLMRLKLPSTLVGAGEPFLAELSAGWKTFRSQRWLWGSISYFGVANLAVAPFFVLGPVIAAHSLGGAGAWGIVMTGSAVGALLGSLIAIRLRPARPLFDVMLLGTICGLPLLMLARPFSALVIAAAQLTAVAIGVVINAIWLTVLQANVPTDRISRVSAYDWLVSTVLQPIGFALAGPLAAAIGTSTTLLGCGAALFFAPLLLLRAVPAIRDVTLPERPAWPEAGEPELAASPAPGGSSPK